MNVLLPLTLRELCTHTEGRIDTLILLGKISPLSFSPNQACVVFGDLLLQTNQSIVV